MYESEANDNDEMRGWVWAKQLWNPDLDTKTLLKDFVFGYYKESAQPLWDYEMMMWDYWEKWHKVPHQCGDAVRQPADEQSPVFLCAGRANVYARLHGQDESVFHQGRKPGEKRRRSWRACKKAKLSLLYLELSQNLGYYTEFGDFVYGKSMRESRARKERFKPYLDEFIDLCKKNELATLGIPVTLEKITAKWQSCIDMDRHHRCRSSICRPNGFSRPIRKTKA